MYKHILIASLALTCLSCKPTKEASPDYKITLGKVARHSEFSGGDSIRIWGGSAVKGEDGLYHMLYSRWPKQIGWEWVTNSEIAHAVSKSVFGPYKHVDVALPVRGDEYWDGHCTHNPTIHKFDGKYFLYYMGNHGDKKIVSSPDKEKINWVHRNNQRIGVAVADKPAGPWKRFDKPVLDITHNDSTAHDALMTSNPSVCQMPDGKILMVYKAVGKKRKMPMGGPVVHMVAIGETPTGPFKKYPDPIFLEDGVMFPAEDPYIWYADGRFRAIVKFMAQTGKDKKFKEAKLVHYDSEDGINWQKGKYFEISDKSITWEDGTVQKFKHLERPQVVFEKGMPVALYCAADSLVRQSSNIQIPLIITKIESNAK